MGVGEGEAGLAFRLLVARLPRDPEEVLKVGNALLRRLEVGVDLPKTMVDRRLQHVTSKTWWKEKG